MPPVRPAQRTHPDSGNGGSGDVGRKNGIDSGSSTGRDNDLRCLWRLPSPLLSLWDGHSRHDDDNGRRKGGRGDGEVTVRQWQGNGEAMVRQRRGNGEETKRQQRGNKDAKAIGYGAAGGRGNKAIDKRITNNRT